MWYEILPSLVLTMGFVALPIASSVYYKYGKRYGKSQPRNWATNKMDNIAYKRDLHITGNEFIPRGLESIPDVD